MKFTVAAPATTANIGAGFDVFGAALGLENTFEVETGREGFVLGGALADGPELGRNLFLEAYRAVFARCGGDPEPVHVLAGGQVPLRSGLGGSASAVCAGILAAGAVRGDPLAMDDALSLATELDGHPDNVAACLLGGVTLAVGGGRPVTRRLAPPRLRAVVFYPGSETGTEAARKLLPQTCELSAAVHNLGRVSLFVYAMMAGEHDLLRFACDDLLHEPMRVAGLPFAAQARDAALGAGALAMPLSGSGPSLLAIVRPEDAETVRRALEGVAVGLPRATVYDLPFAEEGARIIGPVR